MCAMDIRPATDPKSWDAFLASERFSPFLQSWTMGEVYRSIGQQPLRFEVTDEAKLTGICFGHIVPAKRGKHLSIPYGPVLKDTNALPPLIEALMQSAKEHDCSFIRVSPFWPANPQYSSTPVLQSSRPSPLHLLAEHIWYVPLQTPDPWGPEGNIGMATPRTEEALLSDMRSTARNLIRRAQKEGVTVEVSPDPVQDLRHFLTLHDETRKRHGFTPYSNAFFSAQVSAFAAKKQASLYLARFNGEVIAASIHMHFGGETSYHHGASTQKYRNIPASYLLQWTAMRDALRRGDRVYNFWGISPEGATKHPFAGVRTFKTAFGGSLLPLVHCMDIPLSKKYLITQAIETVRKWRRGF